MGTWGMRNFENDEALDWVGELICSHGTDAVYKSLDAVLQQGASEYLEAPDCCRAMAAAEVVAAARGRSASDLPEEVFRWVQSNLRQVPADLLERGRQAAQRIGSTSELRDLWEESSELVAWEGVVNDLQSRLT